MYRRHPQLLDRTLAQVLVVDIQERFAPVIDDYQRVIDRSTLLLKVAGLLSLPVTVTEQYPKGLGPTVEQIRQALGQHQLFEKTTFSVGGCADARQHLQVNQRPQILVVGIETHVCVQQTAFDLRHDGFEVHIAVDAVSSRSPFERKCALRRMESEGIVLNTVESATFEMLVEAGSDEFKQASSLIKAAGTV